MVALNATDEKELVGKVEDAGALMVYHFRRPPLGRQTIDRLENVCKVITRCGVVDTSNVELAAAQRRGIPVCNVPDYGTEEVADSAIGMILTLTRGIHALNSRLRDGREEWHYRARGSARPVSSRHGSHREPNGLDVVLEDHRGAVLCRLQRSSTTRRR